MSEFAKNIYKKMWDYQKIMDDLEEMEDFFDSYDDSDLTAEQWDRLLSLMERANRLVTYSYY